MLLQKKIDRALKWSRERRMREDGLDPEEEELKEELRKIKARQGTASEELPSAEELKEEGQKVDVSRSEMRDLILSGMLTIIPICIMVIVAMCLLVYALFGGFS